jgi:hypothetical protein
LSATAAKARTDAAIMSPMATAPILMSSAARPASAAGSAADKAGGTADPAAKIATWRSQRSR